MDISTSYSSYSVQQSAGSQNPAGGRQPSAASQSAANTGGAGNSAASTDSYEYSAEIMAEFDTDGDGMLSASELANMQITLAKRAQEQASKAASNRASNRASGADASENNE